MLTRHKYINGPISMRTRSKTNLLNINKSKNINKCRRNGIDYSNLININNKNMNLIKLIETTNNHVI